MAKVPTYPTAGQTPVLHIRLNPEDMMSCIDVLNNAKINTTGMSLAMVARLVLSALLEGCRVSGEIPRRDGFEYQEMIQPFVQTSQLKKLQIMSGIRNTEIARVQADLPASQFAILQSAIVQSKEDSIAAVYDRFVVKKGRLYTRALELQTKRDVDPDNFTAADADQLKAIEVAIDNLNIGVDVDVSKLL